jgi:RHS repeat-associated protein
MISNGSNSYTYDGEGRLLTAGGYTYTYDGDGQRVKKASGSTGTLYWPDTAGNTLSESNLSGSLQEEYFFLNGKRVARRDVSNDAVHYFFPDHLGSTSVITNSTGTTLEQDLDYFPYGGIAYGAPSDHYLFTGKERDAESGLDNFEARYYGSSLGRFMSPDPLGGHQDDPQPLNRYAYVRNNPLNLTDPTGLDFNLQCTQTKDNASTCQNGVQGTTTTDANGKSTFNATVISNDKNGNLVDQNGNQYNATVSGAGVSFSQAGSNQSSMGTFINGSNATTIQGSGDLAGFTFNFTYSNARSGVNAGGTFSFGGSPGQAAQALMNAGFQSQFIDDLLNPFHAGDQNTSAFNFRSQGDPQTGAGSGHFIVRQPVVSGRFYRLPIANVPTRGEMHLGEHNAYGSWDAFKSHTEEVWHYLF